jgi:hypothetical protein
MRNPAWGIALLAGSEDEPHRTAQISSGEIDFGAKAAARASDGVIFARQIDLEQFAFSGRGP